jgi:hypothetical protein
MEMKTRQPDYWPIDRLLADIMVNRYKRDVVFRCLSSGDTPVYFSYFFGSETLRRF